MLGFYQAFTTMIINLSFFKSLSLRKSSVVTICYLMVPVSPSLTYQCILHGGPAGILGYTHIGSSQELEYSVHFDRDSEITGSNQ